MANFLDLCRDVAQESGTLAGGGFSLATVTGATGRAGKIVGWTAKAWRSLQMERRDWQWMRRDFASPLTIGKARYTPAELGIDRFGAWYEDRPGYQPLAVYDPAIGVADEGALPTIDYDDWRTRYARGSHDATRPTEYAISPNGDLCFGATPDKAYVVRGEYRVAAQILAEDTDIPEVSEEYHPAIVWEALRLMANADEAPASVASAASESMAARYKLDRDMLPKIRGAGTLA